MSENDGVGLINESSLEMAVRADDERIDEFGEAAVRIDILC